VIFVGLLILGVAFYAFCSFWGLVLGGTAAYMSKKYKSGELPQKGNKYAEPPSHVNLLTPPTPYDQEADLAGWDGVEELDVEEDF
jgi:hypothetical protein